MSDIRLEENSLVFSEEGLEKTGLQDGDKVRIEYLKDTKFYPLLIKGNIGNIIKNGKVSFRGKQNRTLRAYGTNFSLVEEGICWRLVSTDLTKKNNK